MNDDSEHPTGPDDVTLLAAIARLWQQVDPPPADLADGVLARIAAEDLEFDLLTLVESERRAGRRTLCAPRRTTTSARTGAWSLEYAGPRLPASTSG